MAWSPPTIAEFKARYPRFAAVDDAVVQGALDEAATRVDETWVNEANFRMGYMLYAAHVLTADGHGTGAESAAGEAGTLGYKVMKSGSLTLERFDNVSGGGGDEYLQSTSYGRRFLELIRLNFPAVMVV